MSLCIEAHGHSYRIEDPGGIIGRNLRGGSPYERKVLERIHRLDVDGCIVDVGAGVGNHTLWFAAICQKPTISFEPLDFHRLANNVDLNPDLPIEIHPVGLGEVCEGEHIVTAAPVHVTGRALHPDDKVPIRTLDSYELEDVGLIKIDVEGMEPEVLRGAIDTIHRCHPRIFAEAIDESAARRNKMALPKGYVHVGTFGATPLEEWAWPN